MSAITIVQPRLILEDPHNCTDMADALTVLGAVYDTPVRRVPSGFEPGLASAWSTDTQGRVWTLHIRPGVRFHDGAPCDAAAVAANLMRMARPDMGVTLGAPGVWAQYLGGAQIEATDPLTVRIALVRPMSDLLDLLAYAHIASPAVLADPVARPVGSGPYAIQSVGPAAILARANPGHYAGPPAFDRIRWQAEPDPAARLAALDSGAAQVANRLSPGADGPGLTLADYLSPTTIIFLLNAARGPCADPRIRLALNLALDRAALVERVLGGAGVPLHGFLSPAHRGYLPTARPQPRREAARALLAAAGVAEELVLDVDCPTSLPDEAQALCAAVTAQLGPLGVTLRIRLHEDRTAYAHRVRRSEIGDMCVFDSSPLSTFRVLAEKIDSRVRGSWWQGYANREVEALIDAARITPDEAARTALFERCHTLMLEDPPWLPCYCHLRRIGLAGRHPGWTMPPDGVIDVRALPAGLGIADG